MAITMSPEEAMAAMQAGDVPDEVIVNGDLRFYTHQGIASPKALPTSLTVEELIIHDASLLTRWPQVLRCKVLYLWKLAIPIPDDAVLFVERELDMRDASLESLAALRVAPECVVEVVQCERLTRLPDHLTLATLIAWGCPALAALPADMQITQRCTVLGATALRQLPQRLHVSDLVLRDAPLIDALPDDAAITGVLDLSGCSGLRAVPADIAATTLVLTGCTSLTALPDGLSAQFVSLAGCTGITTWDDPSITTLRQLDAHDCHHLRALPPNLRTIDELDVSGCARLTALPSELRISEWIDVGGTPIRALPPAVAGTVVRWHGVNVPGRVAFHPATITAQQVLAEPNAEVRRVMLERIGMERFIAEAQPTMRDADRDRGGARRLLAVAIDEDESLVVLQVQDPSTQRLYLLRVPPTMTTCHQAAAWIAGFDTPEDYHPVAET